MIESEHEAAIKYSIGDQNAILQEYNEIVETLKIDLSLCKVEQNKIRSGLETLQNDSKNANDIVKEYFSQIHEETCGNENVHNKEMVANLQERITVLKMEKDSVFQLWQIALKAIDALEEELRTFRTDGKGSKVYEEHMNNVRETYSEAIKALEAKLLQAKENFLKQQTLWETSKQKIEELTKEKADILKKYEALQKDYLEKDRSNVQLIEALRTEVTTAKAEIQKLLYIRTELEAKLNEAMKFTTNLIAKDEETKCKMSEALELVESAVREKDLILAREVRILEEKNRLELRLSKVTEEHTAMLEKEIGRIKDAHEHNIKKYMSEIKELKVELRQKTALLEGAQRECRLTQEELEKVQRNSEDFMRKSNVRIQELEEKLKNKEFQFQVNDETQKQKYDMSMRRLEAKITELEEKLSVSNDKLRKTQESKNDQVEDQIQRANEKTRNAIEQYTSLEKRLAKSFEDKENLVTEMKYLQSAFDREIQKREHERHLLEDKIHDLELSMQKTPYAKQDNPHNLLNSEMKKPTLDITVENKEHCCRSILSEQLNKAQERFDRKIKELSHHVEVHQKLSKKWKEEAKSLAFRFQEKSKDHRAKINALKKENNDLSKELFACQQELAKCKMQNIQKHLEENENR